MPKRPEAPVAIVAGAAPVRSTTNYPPPYAARVAGRTKRALGEIFGLTNFGVNLTTLPAGVQSSVRHQHQVQDEFVYLLDGEVVLVHDEGETVLSAGMCAGFAKGGGAHHLVNRSPRPAVFLEVGDRSPGDRVAYPDDDLAAEWSGETWRFQRKDGSPL